MFSFVKSNTKPEFPVIKTLPSKASTTYKIGDALVMSGGVLEKATGTTVPEYICACNYAAPATGQEDISVYLIDKMHEYETTFAAAPTDIKEGSKVTIHTDAAQVTATTASGIVTVVKKLGNESGSKCIVKF